MDATGQAKDQPDRATLSFDEAAADDDPLVQFGRWLKDATAAGLAEPTAMVLATVSAGGRPRARTVLLKDFGPAGFTFYTNRTSRKGTDLAEVPRASACFPWYPMHRQVIIEGTVRVLTTQQSQPYFRSRPRGSQLGAWASRQSSVIGSRDELEGRYAELEAALARGHRGADARLLGRLPAGARGVRVLAGPGEPAARQVQVPRRGRGLGAGAAGTLTVPDLAVRQRYHHA